MGSALLIDFDGVLRRWDTGVATEVERRYSLAPGILRDTLFEPELVRAASLGEITDAEWVATVAARIGVPEAVTEWAAYRGELDPQVLAFAREVHAAGIPVVLATNATDRLDADLALLGLSAEFPVANSSLLRVAKPSREFYLAASDLAGTAPGSCLFVDDTELNVAGARAAGLRAHRWTGPADIPHLRQILVG